MCFCCFNNLFTRNEKALKIGMKTLLLAEYEVQLRQSILNNQQNYSLNYNVWGKLRICVKLPYFAD